MEHLLEDGKDGFRGCSWGAVVVEDVMLEALW